MVLLWVKNNISLDISGTKRNSKFLHGENLDIVVRRFFLQSMAPLNNRLHDQVLHLTYFEGLNLSSFFRLFEAVTTTLSELL